jgi:hypothetical protein
VSGRCGEGRRRGVGGCVDGSRQQGDVKLCLWKVPSNNEVHHRYTYPKGPLLERLLRWFFFLWDGRIFGFSVALQCWLLLKWSRPRDGAGGRCFEASNGIGGRGSDRVLEFLVRSSLEFTRVCSVISFCWVPSCNCIPPLWMKLLDPYPV